MFPEEFSSVTRNSDLLRLSRQASPRRFSATMRRMKTRGLVTVLIFVALLLAQTPGEVEITAEPHHHLALENQYVRVFKVQVDPNSATLMHRHRHDYVFVTLGASEIENDVAGEPPAVVKLKDGETRFTPGDFAHIAKDLAPTPFRNVTIELLKDEEARKSPPPKWEEERGLNVLDGGTQDVLFVKDGVRVSDIQLQPGGVVPKHHHAGPHLVVALTDLALRSDVEGKGSMQLQQKAGDIAWVAGASTHALTNTGKQLARFITLEFPEKRSCLELRNDFQLLPPRAINREVTLIQGEDRINIVSVRQINEGCIRQWRLHALVLFHDTRDSSRILS